MSDIPLMVCCSVLRAEIELLVAQGRIVAVPRFLPSDLCGDYRALGRALPGALAEGSYTRRVLVVGLCHPAIDAIAERHRARRVSATNCISMLIGEEPYARAVSAGAYFLLPGWAATWRQSLIDRLGLDGVCARSLLGEELRQAIYLDNGVIAPSGQFLDEFASYSGLCVERQATSLDHLVAGITEVIDGV